MRWCDQHQDDFIDDEFIKLDGTWYHERDGRHLAEEPWPDNVDLSWPGPTGSSDDR